MESTKHYKTAKEKRRHNLPIQGVERDITTDPANITGKIKKYNKQLYSYNFNKFDEMKQPLNQ